METIQVFEGVIERVNVKSGATGGKAWKRMGFLIGDQWYNTFDDLKFEEGARVRVEWRPGKVGRDIVGMVGLAVRPLGGAVVAPVAPVRAEKEEIVADVLSLWNTLRLGVKDSVGRIDSDGEYASVNTLFIEVCRRRRE